MRDPNCIRRRLLRISEQCYSPNQSDPICRWRVLGGGDRNPSECTVGEDSALIGTIDLDAGRDAIVVAFRGTLARFGSDADRAESALDWLNNGECAQLTFRNRAGQPLGRVHRGFLEAVNRVWESRVGRPGLEERLRQLIDQNPARAIYVTGHSKGGAMANIAAMRIKDEWPNSTVRVVTFASARPGDAAFATAYAARLPNSVRYESWPDVVPELPPGRMGSFWLRSVVAPVFRLGRLRELRIADLDPFYPVGIRNPEGNWIGDALRKGVAILTGFFGFKIDPRQLVLAHSIAAGTAYDVLVCSAAGADHCDHQ